MAGVWSSVRVQRRWQAVALPSVFRQSGSSKFVSARRKNDSLPVTTGRGWHARGAGSIAYSCELLAAPCPLLCQDRKSLVRDEAGSPLWPGSSSPDRNRSTLVTRSKDGIGEVGHAARSGHESVRGEVDVGVELADDAQADPIASSDGFRVARTLLVIGSWPSTATQA
jgi:hypothetical protein